MQLYKILYNYQHYSYLRIMRLNTNIYVEDIEICTSLSFLFSHVKTGALCACQAAYLLAQE